MKKEQDKRFPEFTVLDIKNFPAAYQYLNTRAQAT
jgi:hypothetical protein